MCPDPCSPDLEFKREGCVLGRIDKKAQGGYNVGIQTSEVGAVAFDEVKYKNEYTKQNYDIIRATVPKGRGKDVKNLAQNKGMSVSQLIVDALESHYKIDLSKPGNE